MIKLFVDAHVFDDGFGGTRTYLEGIYKKLVNRTDIEFYFAACNVDILRKTFGDQDNVHYIIFTSKSKFKRLGLEIPSIIKKYKIDYAHYQYICPIIKRCKEIVTIHDLLFLDYPEYFPPIYRLKNKLLFGVSAKRADILLTVSEFSKKEISKFFGISSKNIHVVNNGILLPQSTLETTDIRKRYELENYILTVSRIEPRKNHIMLLKAFVELNLWEHGYKLVLVGRYDWSNRDFDDYYKSLEENIKNSVLIITASYSELVELYKNAKLFVFPSFAEGFGIPPLEAIAFDCPLLCSKATAMSEFNLDEDFYFDPSNLDELKSKMLYLINSKPNLNAIKKTVLNQYDWQIMADKLYDLIQSDYTTNLR